MRDVAEAHCVALMKPNVDGERIIISAAPTSYNDIFNWLSSEHPKAPIPKEFASVEKIV